MMVHSVYFDLGFTTIKVIASDSETIRSLQEFFHPYIPTTPETTSFYEVAALIDPQRYDATKSNLPLTPDAEIATTLQHDHEYKLKCFNSNGITLIEDGPLQVFYLVHAHERRTQILATNGSRVRTALLRIVRGAWIMGHSGMIVHGCVLVKNGNGIVVSGDKYAGKTTSLLSLCTTHGYDIVANDRLLLTRDGIAKGIPTVVKLRTGTLKPFPALRHLLDAPLFGVSDLARELGVAVKKQAPLKAVAFLSYDESVSEPVITQLSPAEASEAIRAQLFSRFEYEWIELMKLGDFMLDEPEDVLKSVSCFRLSSNETQADKTASLLDALCQS